MTRDRLAVLGLGLMVVAALVTALVVVGGPGRGAEEKRDDARLGDLMQLHNQVSCVRNGEVGALPETLEPSPGCDFGVARVDPITSAPYRYERLPDDRFRLCAEFENPQRIARQLERRLGEMGEDGCILFAPEPFDRPRR